MIRSLVAAATAALLLTACSGDGDPRVEVAEVERSTVAETVDAPGTVGARATATVDAPADAVVREVLVEDGAEVQAGAVLLRLESPSAVERLRQAQAAQASAGVDLQVPRAELGPVLDAADAAAEASFAAGRAAAAQVQDPEQRRAAEQQVADAEQQYRSASAAARRTLASLDAGAASVEDAVEALGAGQRAQAAAAVSAAQAVVDALEVRAPLAGVVTLGGTAPAPAGGGDLAGIIAGLPPGLAGQAGAALGGAAATTPSTTAAGLPAGTRVATGTPLVTVTDVGGLSVTAEVDETDVLLVEPGQDAVVELDAVPGATYPATVEAVDVSPSASAGGGVTYRVRLSLAGGTTSDDAPAPRPLPGMSAVVELQVRTAEGVLAVPSAAVVRDGGSDAVFVVEDGRAQRVEVVLGAAGQDSVEVRRGLRGGEQVVVRDADRLSDGQAVEQ